MIKYKRISVSALKELKNKELFNFYSKTMLDVEEQQLENSHILMLFNNANRHVFNHEDLSKTSLAHAATPNIHKKIDKCHGLLTRIKGSVHSLRNIKTGEESVMYEELNRWMSKSKSYMLTKLRGDQEEVMRALEAGYNENLLISEYLEKLNLDDAFKEAVQLNSEMLELANIRTEDWGYYKELRLTNREQSLFDLQLLVDGFVALANIANDEQETYQLLHRSINKRLIEAQAIWKSRITRLNNGEEVEETEGFEDESDNQSEEGDETTPDSDPSAMSANNNAEEDESPSDDITENDEF